MTYQFIYPDFIDKATGKTLVATPGSSYTIAVASGRNPGTPAYPNDGRWSASSGIPFLAVLPREPETVLHVLDVYAEPAEPASKDSPEPGNPGEGEGA